MWFRGFRSKADRNAPRFGSSLGVLTVILLLASSVVNILLVLKTRELRAVIATVKSEANLKTGTSVSPIVAQDLTGHPVTIRFEDSDLPTLLYVFTPGCRWCQKNEENVRALLQQSPGKVRVIGLSLSQEGLAEYAKIKLPSLPVYSNLELATTLVYKLAGTPETILVSKEGRVMKVWNGAYVGETLHDIEDYFSIKLPGLSKSS